MSKNAMDMNSLVGKSYNYLKRLFGERVEIPGYFILPESGKPTDEIANEGEFVSIKPTAQQSDSSQIIANGNILADIHKYDITPTFVSQLLGPPDMAQVNSLVVPDASQNPDTSQSPDGSQSPDASQSSDASQSPDTSQIASNPIGQPKSIPTGINTIETNDADTVISSEAKPIEEAKVAPNKEIASDKEGVAPEKESKPTS